MKLFERLASLVVEEVAPGALEAVREARAALREVDAIVYQRAPIELAENRSSGARPGVTPSENFGPCDGDTIVAEVIDAHGKVVGVTDVVFTKSR